MIYAVIGLVLLAIAQFVGYRLSLNREYESSVKEIRELYSEHKEDARSWTRQVTELTEVWRVERQQLLDRIQAPSFDHLKHHEVQVIKAKNKTQEPEALDPL